MQVDVPTVCIVNWYSALPGGRYFTQKQLIDVSARQHTRFFLPPASSTLTTVERSTFDVHTTAETFLGTCHPVHRRRSSNWYRWVLCECLSQAEQAQRGVSSSFLSIFSSIEGTCLVAAVHFFCTLSDLWFLATAVSAAGLAHLLLSTYLATSCPSFSHLSVFLLLLLLRYSLFSLLFLCVSVCVNQLWVLFKSIDVVVIVVGGGGGGDDDAAALFFLLIPCGVCSVPNPERVLQTSPPHSPWTHFVSSRVLLSLF